MNIVQYGNHVSFEDVVLFLCCLSPLFIVGIFAIAGMKLWLKEGLNVYS